MIKKELYKEIQKVLPIACVDIVLIFKREFLLLKRNNNPAKGQWWFPGGRIIKGESIKQAARRKAKEETGLDVKWNRILGADSTIFKKGIFGGSVHSINIVVLVEASKKVGIKTDGQSGGYQWFKKIKTSWHSHVQNFLKAADFDKQ
jgi:colanic acid biosynthesis protein WcaH